MPKPSKFTMHVLSPAEREAIEKARAEDPVLAGKGCRAQAEASGAPSERVVDARTDLEKRLSLLGVAPFHLTI